MNILLIEDNKKLAENIKSVLCHEGYKLTHSVLGVDGFNNALENNYDLIILDLSLPDIDGLKVCTDLRVKEITIPILMLTARADINSKVEGLDRGADDYLTKPFLMDELLARIRSLSRRNSKIKASLITLFKNISIDMASKQVVINNKEVRLTTTEYNILELLVINKGKNVTQTEIYESVWGSENTDILLSDTLKVHIASLRKKLGVDIIKTVRDQGYRING